MNSKTWLPWNLSFRYIHCTGQFTPKMKANAVRCLLSSLVWIDSGVVVSQHCLESFFMKKMWRNDKFHGIHDKTRSVSSQFWYLFKGKQTSKILQALGPPLYRQAAGNFMQIPIIIQAKDRAENKPQQDQGLSKLLLCIRSPHCVKYFNREYIKTHHTSIGHFQVS